jgi:hypothetical protein
MKTLIIAIASVVVLSASAHAYVACGPRGCAAGRVYAPRYHEPYYHSYDHDYYHRRGGPAVGCVWMRGVRVCH